MPLSRHSNYSNSQANDLRPIGDRASQNFPSSGQFLRKGSLIGLFSLAINLIGMLTPPPTVYGQEVADGTNHLELDRQVVEDSPVLRRWLVQPVDVLEEIRHNPSFDTTLQVGLTSTDSDLGVAVGVDDIFLGNIPITVSASYQQEFDGDDREVNANLRYYVLPLGSYVNVAPQVGYRYVDMIDRDQISGVEVGLQGIFVLSPHSADIRLSQTFTEPGKASELGITSISTSYAVTKRLRLGTNIEWRRSRIRYDNRVGVVLQLIL
ncbi:hypothetical protein [Thalassoporum mexicanum]|uniref:hypothetical protein n=1 Tax=Thalassoporum mexicanum TaxID=3457544 RepID=UPI0012EA8A4E|nr:hypothetical protein [Pseudanabaena sp. PCC 7367]